jgi:hypothetical protein
LLNRWTSARKEPGHEEIAVVKATLAALLPGFPSNVRPPLIAADAPANQLAQLAVELSEEAARFDFPRA